MNQLDNLQLDPSSFAWRDLLGMDVWVPFTPVFGSLTVVGETSYTGRLRFVGKQCFFQVQFSAATSIASAVTDYLNLPATAKGLAGSAIMSNNTANTAVGVCHVDVATSRCYLPAQVASSSVFLLSGWFEFGG